MSEELLKEVKAELAKRGITDIPDEEIEPLVEAGLDKESILDILIGEAGEPAPSVPEASQQPAPAPAPQPAKEEKPISVPVDSSVKKVVQKAVSSTAKDSVQAILQQAPPKAKVKIYIWDENAQDWAYVDTINADVIAKSDLHAYLKRKYAKFDGVNKFRLDIYDAAGNLLTQTEVQVLVDKPPAIAGLPIQCSSGDEMEVLGVVKNLFEELNKEKESLYQKMLDLQKQLAEKEVQRAQETMRLLEEQMKMMEDTYRQRLEQLQALSQQAPNAEAEKAIELIREQLQAQLNELRTAIVQLNQQFIEALKQIKEGDKSKESESANALVALVTPLIQATLQKLNEKDDSLERVVTVIKLIEEMRKKEEPKEPSQPQQPQIDPITQFKTLAEIIRSFKEEKKEIDPMQQFNTLFSLVKELMPKEEKKDAFEEIEKIHRLLDVLGIKKDDSSRDRIIADIFKEMREFQEKLFERFSQSQKELLEALKSNNDNKQDTLIQLLMQRQEQQMEQMRTQMQMMFEQTRSMIETLVQTQQQAQLAKMVEEPKKETKDPIDALLENMAKIEKLKQVIGANSGGSGGGISSVFSKIIEGLSGILPALLAQQQAPAVPAAPYYGGYGQMPYAPQPTRIIRKRRVVRRPVPARRVVAQPKPAQVPQKPPAQPPAVPKQPAQQVPQQAVQQVPQKRIVKKAPPKAQKAVEQKPVHQPAQQQDLAAIKQELIQNINIFDKQSLGLAPDQVEAIKSTKPQTIQQIKTFIKSIPDYEAMNGKQIFAAIAEGAKQSGIDAGQIALSMCPPFDSREEMVNELVNAMEGTLTKEQAEQFVDEAARVATEFYVDQKIKEAQQALQQ